ncbi:PASTA domain-containing protein [Streptomyces sp. NPDC047046]|uniref:PASTA domain-containing protein n=1 Tax=Streptomyces sp. NPDC047046 TaxID=3155378 RepID=UPI0033EDBFBB
MSALVPEPTEFVLVPRLLGLMAMDAVTAAQEKGLATESPDDPEVLEGGLDYVVRQYPEPGARVPHGAVVTLWFDTWPDEGDEGGGGTGVREPLDPGPGASGLEREKPEPDADGPEGVAVSG